MMNFSQIKLEPEQKELFIRIVEAVRKIPRDERMKMNYMKSAGGKNWLQTFSKTAGTLKIDNIVDGDLDELSSKGLLRKYYGKKGGQSFTISPEGLEYYDWHMKQQGKPVERIETHTLRYLEIEDFSKQYPDAYRKIKQAEEMLWSADKEEQFTTIGHLCREVLQEFADHLYNKVKDEPSDEPKSHDKNRVKAVIEAKKADVGTTVRPFLDALYSYWDALSDLVQRQEHGGQKEGEPVNWEDSRRVVFQTVNVMVELHRTFGKQ